MLLASEVLWWLLFVGVYGGGLWVVARVARLLPLPLPFALAAALPVGVVAVIGLVGVVAALLPRLRSGTYAMTDMKVQAVWGLRYLLTRLLFLGPMTAMIQYSVLLRWLAWRAMGAQTELGSMISGDVPLPDMGLVSVGRGAMVGSRSRLSTHSVAGGRLVLGRIELGRGAVVGGDCNVGPNTVIGQGAILSFGVLVAGDCEIGAKAFVGKLARLGSGVKIGEGAVVETESAVPNGTVIPPGGRWENPAEERPVGRLA